MVVDRLVDWLYLVWFDSIRFRSKTGMRLEKPPDACVHETLHAGAHLHEPAERLAAEVHAHERDLRGKPEIVLGLAVIGEGIPRAEPQLGIQAHALPVIPRELHHGHRAEIPQPELPVGRLRPVAGHVHRVGRHIVAHDRPAEPQPAIHIVDILRTHASEEKRVLEREMPHGERRPQDPARHIRHLRQRELSIRDGKLVPVLVILGKDGTRDNQAQE